MPPSSFRHPPHRVLDQFYQHLRQSLNDLCPDELEEALSLDTIDPPDTDRLEKAVRVEGPDEVAFEITLELCPISEETCDLRAETEEGRARHFTCHLPEEGEDPENLRRVSRSISTFLLSEIEHRRGGDACSTTGVSAPPPHVPLLHLDENGTIQDLTEGARRVLGYSSETSIDPNFFSHVHGQNLRRVMQDLAHMVSHQKQNANWLLRLRTDNQRWRWYRAAVDNRLDRPEEAIRVLLRPLSDR